MFKGLYTPDAIIGKKEKKNLIWKYFWSIFTQSENITLR